MFSCCCKLTSINLSNFNTNKETNLKMMFDCCQALTTIDLYSFITSNVIKMD